MSLDRALLPTLRRQFGLINRAQVHAAGGTDENIEYRLRSGRWELVLPTVYRLAGVPRSWRQDLMAACLWAGRGAAVSHRSAAGLLDLDGIKEEPVEISCPWKVRPPAEWLLVHRPQTLPDTEIARIGEIPVTSVARTILDLGAVVPRYRVEIALDSGLRDRLVEYKDLRDVLDLHGARGRDGTASLRYLLVERDPDYVPPESQLERPFVPILADPRLPEAIRQYPIVKDGKIVYRIDFAYPEWKVAIEIDSYRHHFGRQSWHKDRTRSNVLVAEGWRVLHLTKADGGRPEPVVKVVLSALREAGYPF